MKACRTCHLLTDGEICPRCGGQVSKDWKGYLIVIDYSKSEIAKRMNIDMNGRYALKGK